MANTDRPQTQTWHPASFAGRGVAIPFLTPDLAGARARRSATRGTEFIIPNPSGGRGVYIVDWDGVRQLCAPTVHDTLLYERLGALQVLAPGPVRATARRLAAEGLAGRAAQNAVAGTEAREREAERVANFLLLMALVEQDTPTGLHIHEKMPRTPELMQRSRLAMARLAPRIGSDPARIANDLEQLAGVFAPVGTNGWASSARLPNLLGRLRSLHGQLREEAASPVTDRGRRLATMLAGCAATFIRCGEIMVFEAQAATADMVALLRDWVATPESIEAMLARPEWMLDGWEEICLLWEATRGRGQRRLVMNELLRRVPVLPREAMAWVREGLSEDMLEPPWRGAEQPERAHAPTPSMIIAQVARNEQLRAMSL